MEGKNGIVSEGTWNNDWGRTGKRQRPVESSGWYGNGPKWLVHVLKKKKKKTSLIWAANLAHALIYTNNFYNFVRYLGKFRDSIYL